MNIEICDDDRVRTLTFPSAFNEEIIPEGRKCVQIATSGWYRRRKRIQWISVESIKRQANGIVLGGVVEMIIQPPQNLGGIVNQVDIGFGIEVPENFVRVPEYVDVLNLRCEAAGADGLFNCFGGTKVPCSRTG